MINRALKFSPQDKKLLQLLDQQKQQIKKQIKKQKENSKNQYRLALKKATIKSLTKYTHKCKPHCVKSAYKKLQEAKQISDDFKRHIKTNKLTTGTDGTALDDIFRMENLFPKDPIVNKWQLKITNHYIGLIKKSIKQKNFKKSINLLRAALSIDPKNSKLMKYKKAVEKINPAANTKGKNYKLVPKMIYIAGGKMSMSGKLDYTKVARKINVPGFNISQSEITFNDYIQYARSAKIRLNSSGWGIGNRPVINISWKSANSYTKWLSKKTGRKFRLPSEVEWEFAASKSQALINKEKINIYSICKYGNGADKSSKFPWRNTKCRDKYSNKTAPVKTYQANLNKLYDMHGNVSEWTLDCWHNSFRGAPKSAKAWIKGGKCNKRVIKGGGWNSSTNAMLPSYRDYANKKLEYNYIGFRILEQL